MTEEIEPCEETAGDASKGPDAPRHPSLEKTDCNLQGLPEWKVPSADGIPPPADPGGKPEVPSADLALLREQLETKTKECAALLQTLAHAKVEVESLRSDFAGQKKEYMIEIRTLNEVIQKQQAETALLEAEIARLNQEKKQLKAQNLDLQYHLNLWGIPVSSGVERDADAEDIVVESSFFPPLHPLVQGEDPIPAMLRGDLESFYFPSLLQFLSGSNLMGVLTVVAETIVSKLYLEKAVLRLAGWNNRDQDLSLRTLLDECQLFPDGMAEALAHQELYDMELAAILAEKKALPEDTIRAGLKEHTRVILSYLFQLKRGSFFFQAGQILTHRELHFNLPVTDLLLKTAAEVDEGIRGVENVGK